MDGLNQHRLKQLQQSLWVGLLTIGNLLVASASIAQITVEQTAIAQTVATQSSATARAEYRQQQVRQVRAENYSLTQHPVTAANEDFWRNILWTTAIVEPQQDYVATAIAEILALTSRRNLADPQLRTIDMAMQVGTQLYLSGSPIYAGLGQSFAQTIEQSQDPMWTAMAFSALTQNGMEAETRQQWTRLIQQRFPNWSQDVYLYATLRQVEDLDNPPELPPLKDLLDWTITSGQPQMYVLCRPDRGVLCQTILKDGNGEFVQENGQLWSVPLSLRSIHGLDWIFSRGQTPQGIYRIQGTVPQPDTEFFRAFGQFSLVNLFVPFEAGAAEFISGQRGTTENLTAYQSLLPPSWRNYFPMQQTYWAGKAGRGLFRIHGSGESTTFFSNNSRYPLSADWNPTIGCLSALELYDDAGRLLQADMPKILGALRSAGGSNFTGYLIVVDVPGDNTPVQAELQAALAELYSSN